MRRRGAWFIPLVGALSGYWWTRNWEDGDWEEIYGKVTSALPSEGGSPRGSGSERVLVSVHRGLENGGNTTVENRYMH